MSYPSIPIVPQQPVQYNKNDHMKVGVHEVKLSMKLDSGSGEKSKSFVFDEADHLTRIHLKLGLEDVGFTVEEEGSKLKIITHSTDQTPCVSSE